MKVRALAMGYYGHKRRREGDVFELRLIEVKLKGKVVKTIKPEEQFSSIWMEKFDAKSRKAKAKAELDEAEVELEREESDDSEVI